MANQAGYLYVIAKGSSGTWSPLFPHPESSVQRNEVVPGRRHQVPGGENEFFTFDEQTGEEKVFILLSKEPVGDLDSTILALSRAGSEPGQPKPDEYQATRLDDQRIAGATTLRRATWCSPKPIRRARQKGQQQDNGTYVVNPNSVNQSDSRVVVDVSLVHR